MQADIATKVPGLPHKGYVTIFKYAMAYHIAEELDNNKGEAKGRRHNKYSVINKFIELAASGNRELPPANGSL